MAVRGRKPKPTELKRLAGNPGKRPLNDAEPSPAPASHYAPRGLSEGALLLWRKVAGELIRLGVMRVTDVPAFVLMAEHYSVARQARDELTALTTTRSQGNLMKHPLTQILKEHSGAFRLYAAEFGLTPATRSRLKAEPLEKEPDLAALLFGDVVDE